MTISELVSQFYSTFMILVMLIISLCRCEPGPKVIIEPPSGYSRTAWYTTYRHGSVGEHLLPLSDSNGPTESRHGDSCGATTIVIKFNVVMDSSTFDLNHVRIWGRDKNHANMTNLPAIKTFTYAKEKREARIEFEGALPQPARYNIEIDVRGASGELLYPFEKNLDFSTLTGDVDGNRTVDDSDSSLATSFFSFIALNPNSPHTGFRSDIDCDGYIDQDDLELLLFYSGQSTREIAEPDHE